MDISTEITAIQAASQGSQLRQPLVDALNKLNSGALPAVTAQDTGKILKVGTNGWEVGEKSGYMPVPTATKQIAENGTHDVTNYASAVVNIQGSSATLVQKTITQNGTYNPANDNADGYSSVYVNVSTQNNLTAIPFYISASSNASSARNGGIKFSSNSNFVIRGFLFYPRYEDSVTIHLREFNASEDIFTQTINNNVIANAWNKLILNNSIALDANKNYLAWYYNNGNVIKYCTRNNTTVIPGFNLMQGYYSASSSDTVPTNEETSTSYCINIFVDV